MTNPLLVNLRLPDTLPGAGLLLGWSAEHEHRRERIGFSRGDPELSPSSGFVDPILLDGEGHVMTIAPTGAGKGTGCIVPALLRFEGPVIVIDPKGENALITARRRREMGHQVAIIDPMGLTGLPSATLNPLDLVDILDENAVDVASSIVSSLVDDSIGRGTTDGNYWQERAQQFVLGVVLHVLHDLPADQRHLGSVRRLVNQTVGEVGQYVQSTEQGGRSQRGSVLDAMQRSASEEVRTIANMLRIGAVSTLGGIISFAQSMVDFIRTGPIQRVMAQSSFDLEAVTRGDPLSIYLVLPPHMLVSHGRVLRLWVNTLMTLVTRRNARPPKSTLFILDEAAQLGRFEPLRTALTLLRGYGLQTWSLWQDGSQISQHYGADWQTMVNNCRAIQCFGPNTMVAARGMADLVGFEDPLRLLDMDDNEMLLQISGDMPVLARLPSYRSDPAFAGQFDANPFHDPTRPVLRPRVPVLPPPAKPRPPANPAVQDVLKMLEDKADD